MSTQPTRAYLEARIAILQEELNNLPRANWDFLNELAPGEVIIWRRIYGPNSVRRNEYQFTAVKGKGNRWHIVSGSSKVVVDFNTLCSDYLSYAMDGEVFRASKFDRI